MVRANRNGGKGPEERISIKDGKKGGSARRAQVKKRQRQGMALGAGGQLAGRRQRAGGEVPPSPVVKSRLPDLPTLLLRKPKPGSHAVNEIRRLPPRRQGDARPLCVARRSPHPPFCPVKVLPSPPIFGEGTFPELCPFTSRNQVRAPLMRSAAYRRAARVAPNHSASRAEVPIPHSAR